MTVSFVVHQIHPPSSEYNIICHVSSLPNNSVVNAVLVPWAVPKIKPEEQPTTVVLHTIAAADHVQPGLYQNPPWPGPLSVAPLGPVPPVNSRGVGRPQGLRVPVQYHVNYPANFKAVVTPRKRSFCSVPEVSIRRRRTQVRLPSAGRQKHLAKLQSDAGINLVRLSRLHLLHHRHVCCRRT